MNCDIKLHGVVKIGPKGQVVLPKEIRDKLWVKPGDSMSIILKNDKYIWILRNEDVSELMEYVKKYNR